MSQGIATFLKPEALHKLGRLSLQSRYVVEGNLAGRHRSPLIGLGGEFADHRDYVSGDDPKFIDWKVLGRTDKYYIRRYENETNLRVYIILDRSASMGFGSTALTKFQYASYLAVALGYVTIKARDSVGFYAFSDQIDVRMGARNSVGHLNNIARTLLDLQPAQTTRTAKTLHMIAESIRRRAMVIVISDLFDEDEEVVNGLAHFRKNNHDVILLHTLDPQEVDFNFKQGGEFQDMETGEIVVADPRGMAEDYRQAFGAFLEKYQRRCVEMRIDYRMVNMREPPETFVRAYLDERKRLSR